MKEYYLYRHIRLDKNEPFYVGMGTKPSKFKNYISEYDRAFKSDGRSPHWNNIVSKTSYEVEIVYETYNRDIIIGKEKEFIKLYGRKDTNNGTLVNFTDGGEGRIGSSPSQETRNKLRELNLGKRMPPHVNALLQKYRGIRASDPVIINKIKTTRITNGTYIITSEAKEKMRLKKLGTKMLPQTREALDKSRNIAPIIQLSMDGDYIREFASLKEAAESVGKKYNNLIACAKGEQNSCGGFKWKYKE